MHLLRVINELVKSKGVTLYLSRSGGAYEKHLDQRIKVVHLTNINRSSLLALIIGVIKLKRIIVKERLDHMISVMDMQNVGLMKMSSSRHAFRRILICQVSPIAQYQNGFINRYILSQIRKCYRRANHIIALSGGVAEEIKKLTRIEADKISVIHNAGFDQKLFNKDFSEKRREVDDQVNLVACGRLSEQKGFDLLIEALSFLPNDDSWHLKILGKGPDEEALAEQAHKLGLSNQIEFVGFVDDPYSFFEKSDLFILSSRWEGFGNVIVEAMVTGTAVLSTSCPHGPDEIITHGKSGWLVAPNDPKSIAEGLRTLISNDELRNKLALEGKKRAMDFAPRLIANRYDELLRACVE